MSEKSILLISFHNQKALGIRYLEKALKLAGIKVNIVFFKGFNSKNPNGASNIELDLLKSIIDKTNPSLIGLSVMSSLYLESVYAVNGLIRNNYNTPIVWGGVYSSLFPERCLDYADFVIRGEGERAIVELTDSVFNDKSFDSIQNLAYKKDSIILNDIRPLEQDLDMYGYPEIGGDNKYFINDDALHIGDPELDSLSFELTASRGCPFVCSYCCSVNLHRLYKGKGTYVRFRSVANVMDELNEAKQKLKKLKVIHFWDEIFSDDTNWVDEFVRRYKAEINLPFEIWGHPLKVNKTLIEKLVGAGLYKVVMGIQSGSPKIRKEIFHRVEKQEEIIEASKVLSDCKVPQVIYDFMLRHPFETEETIKETYELCTKLKPPFELQLHGLNFLPGTDIVGMAINEKLLTEDQLEKIMYSPMQDQYNAYWKYENNNPKINFWYNLIFLTQFSGLRGLSKAIAKNSKSNFNIKLANMTAKLSRPLTKFEYLRKKSGIVFRALKK